MINQLLSVIPDLPLSTKPPVFLVTDRLPGIWRGNLDGQEYFVIDRATMDVMRRALAGATVGPLQVPYMTGIEFREDDDLVARLLEETMRWEENRREFRDSEEGKRHKVLRMYNLWREGRLPADVVVIEVPIERTGYGDFRAVDYGPPKVMVADEDRNPAPDDRIKVIEIKLHRCADPTTGAALILGWNEHPPRLIVGRE